MCKATTTHRSGDTVQLSMQRAARAVQARIDRLPVKERPRESPRAAFDFYLTDPPRGRTALWAKELCYAYPGAPAPVLRAASLELPTGSRTALCGSNGCGKTTLLRLLEQGASGALPPGTSGEVGAAPKAVIGYFRQGLESLDPEKTVLENALEGAVQPEGAVRGLLARLLLRGGGFNKKAGVLSGGERIRLQFAKLLSSPCNLLLLDEPTNFLDLPSIEALQAVLCGYEGTVLFVSHDRAFADAVATRTLRLRDGVLSGFEGAPAVLESWERERRKSVRLQAAGQRQVLELRLQQVVGRLSARKVADREQLERQYEELLAQLRALPPA